jgi:ADP-ribose pyrophosphatase YjhB (NUDIX family)
MIFCNASPAVSLALFNAQGEVLLLERAIDPGKGLLDLPGGFCDGAEPLEQAVARELEEEVGMRTQHYTTPEWVLSHIDAYDYGNEALPVLSVAFKAYLTADVEPVPADDAASARFVSLADINMDAVYFPSIRAVLERLRAEQG